MFISEGEMEDREYYWIKYKNEEQALGTGLLIGQYIKMPKRSMFDIPGSDGIFYIDEFFAISKIERPKLRDPVDRTVEEE